MLVKTLDELVAENEKLKRQLDQAGSQKTIEQLQDLVDNTSDLIMLLSKSGRFLFVNKAWRENMGYSSQDVTNLNLRDIMHPQFSEATLSNLEKIQNGEKIPEFETTFRNKEGKRVYLSGSVSFNAKTSSFRCILRNITQRRRAERSQNLYYNIAQLNLNTPDLHEFLHQVHLALQQNIQANNFFVALYNPNKGYLNFPYYVDDYFKSNVKFTKRRLGNGLTEYAIVHNKPLFLYKEEIEKLAAERKFYLYGVIPEVLLCVPLRVGDRTTGVIGVKSYSDRNKFTNRDLELLEFISGQVAVALARKQTEQDMKRQTARLNAIFDSSSHMIWTLNRRFQLSSFNKNYANLLESQLGAFPQNNVSIEKLGWRLIAPEDRPVLQEKYNLAFRGKPQYFEMHWGKIGGGENWYEFYLNPILPSEGGQIEEVSGIARDITEKKNAELALRKSEEKFRNIVESFLDIYYRTDLAGNITMISPSVLEHTGYTISEVMGEKVDKFFVNALDSSKHIKGLLKAGNLTNFEVNVRKKTGELRQFMLNIRLIRNEENVPFAVEGVARDITELKVFSENLQKAKDEAEYSLKAKERFLANMSHEIRTPMNGVIGMIDLLNETPLNIEQKDYVHTIKKSSETLLTILNDILDLSKIEAGKMELHNAPLDIKELLDRLVALFGQRAIEKQNKLTYKIAPDVPPYWIADQTRLLQIFSNLTSNALKFTENGAITVSLSKISSNGKLNVLRGEVADTGIGISDEGMKMLFGAFQQLDNSTKKSFGGTGLGLAISRELCRMMKGDMGVISEVGKGSIFWFTFEVRSTTISPTQTFGEQNEVVLTNFFKTYQPKILLVDDNQVNRKVASEILQKSGCLVVTAESGREAIEIFGEDNDFDLIFMDIQMPEMDGIETTKNLRKEFGKALPKVVAMTAYSMQHDRERFLSQGMDDYVPKPIRAQILVQKVRDLAEPKMRERVKEEPNNQESGTPAAAYRPAEQLKNRENEKTIEKNEKLAQASPINLLVEQFSVFDMEIVNQLEEMVGKETLLSVFEDFERDAEEQINNAKEAYKTRHVKTIQQELHTLKGNSGTIGLMRIHEIVQAIEVPAKTGDLTDFEEKMKILEEEFLAFRESYKSVI